MSFYVLVGPIKSELADSLSSKAALLARKYFGVINRFSENIDLPTFLKLTGTGTSDNQILLD